MEPIFWKKLPCLNEQKGGKWLEKLVRSVQAWTPTPGPPHTLGSLQRAPSPTPFGKLETWQSSLSPTATAEPSPEALTFPTSLTSPTSLHCHLYRPCQATIISPQDRYNSFWHVSTIPGPLPSILQRIPEWFFAKDTSDCATFTLTPTSARNEAKTPPKPGWFDPLTPPLFSGCQSCWWLLFFKHIVPWAWTTLPSSSLGELCNHPRISGHFDSSWGKPSLIP